MNSPFCNLCSCLGVVVVLTAITATCPIATADPLRIGTILPLTGANAGNGAQTLQGMKFAQQQIPSASGLVFDTEDFGSVPNQAITAYQKLRSRGQLAAVTAFSSPAAMALREIARRDRIPLFGITAAPGFTADPGYTFRLSSSAVDEVDFIRKLWTDAGMKRVTLVYAEDDYGTSYWKLFQSDPRVTSLAIPPGETDLRSTLSRIKIGDPDLIVLALFGQQAGVFVRQAADAKIAKPVLCAQACTNPDFFRVGAGAEEGTLITTPVDVENADLRAAFWKQFNEEPSFITWAGYDLIAVIASVHDQCKDAKDPSDCIGNAARSGQDFQLARGKARFDDRGELHWPQQINRAKQGKFVRCADQSLRCP